jgi:hypothetical protein
MLGFIMVVQPCNLEHLSKVKLVYACKKLSMFLKIQNNGSQHCEFHFFFIYCLAAQLKFYLLKNYHAFSYTKNARALNILNLNVKKFLMKYKLELFRVACRCYNALKK